MPDITLLYIISAYTITAASLMIVLYQSIKSYRKSKKDVASVSTQTVQATATTK